MNETVTIKEGGLTRRLAPIDKLKINTTDNKDSMWIPTKSGNTGVLHASENGIYIASEDGYEAYSEVIVRVTKDSYEGDTSFDDWDYETPDMDLENWDPETIEDFELDPDGFDDIFNNEDEWKDIDKPIDIKMDNPKIQDTKISGIDPVTGNEMEVGLDEDGYLTESILPSSIKIITPPNKLEYMDGQKIDLHGIVVQAYTEDGNVWQNSNYPNGIIPIKELVLPVSIADFSQVQDVSYASDLLPEEMNPFTPRREAIFKDASTNITTITYSVLSGKSGTLYYCGWGSITTLRAAKEPEQVAIIRNAYNSRTGEFIGSDELTSGTTSYTYNGKTVYYASGDAGHSNVKIDDPLPYINDSSALRKIIAWTLVYGDVLSGGQIIPVQWIRSDGTTLEDSFKISVSEGSGDHGQYIDYNGGHYVANEELNAEAHYESGTVWNRNTGAIYSQRDAVALGMLVPVDESDGETSSGSDHEGGHF